MGPRNSKDNKISQEGTTTQHSTPNTSNRADISVENKKSNPTQFKKSTNNNYSSVISLIRKTNYNMALKQLEIMEDQHSESPDFHYWKGLAHLGLNDLQKAQECCEQAIKYDPNHKLALAEIGNIYILAQKYEEAHQVFTELLKIDQKSFEAHLGLGFIRTQINDFKTAQEHYEFALNCGVEEKITSLNYGHMLFKQKNYDMALKFYTKSLAIDKEYLSAFKAIGNLYYQQKKFNELLEFCEQNSSNSSWNIHVLQLKSQAYFGLEQYDKAQQICELILMEDKNNLEALYNISKCLKAQGKYSQALNCLEKVLLLSPKNKKLLNFKANLLISLQRFQQALQTCDELFQLDADDSYSFYIRGLVYMNMRAFGNAIDDFEKAINFELHHTFNQKVYQSKIKCHLEFQQFQQIQDCYDFLLAFTNNDQDKIKIHIDKGYYYLISKDKENAEINFNKALKYQLNPLETQVKIANCFRDTKYFKQALMLYDKIIQANSKFVDAYIEKAILMDLQQNNSQTIHLCSRAIDLQKTQAKPYMLRGKANIQTQQYDEALQDFEQVLKLEPNNHQALFESGQAQYMSSNFEKACEMFGKALAIAPEIEQYHIKRAIALSLQDFDKEAIEYLKDAINQFPEFEDCQNLIDSLEAKPKHVREYANVFVYLIVMFFEIGEQLSKQESLVPTIEVDSIIQLMNQKMKENFPKISNLFEIVRYFILNKFDCEVKISNEQIIRVLLSIYQAKYHPDNGTKVVMIMDMIELGKKIARLKDRQIRAGIKLENQRIQSEFLKFLSKSNNSIFISSSAGFAIKDSIQVLLFLILNFNTINSDLTNLKNSIYGNVKNGVLDAIKPK
ncbi:unnamed protein product [Paramecium octaurelia]|uniref:Tetratricopeptide repeat protein n=1 Tax=Paramecium octaurelia TaxID=43137 RepID=A0A8S1VHH2_PAROT|nr:unnamed protein product [Paramecium octaurelia]